MLGYFDIVAQNIYLKKKAFKVPESNGSTKLSLKACVFTRA